MAELTFLGNIQGIQKRPEMYIGASHNPDHLLTEILDNAIDECLNGYAKNISLDIDNENNIVVIQDDGRGIPSHDVQLPDSNDIINSIVGACTHIHSGGKFNDQLYQKSIGLHGIGMTAVNALSSTFSVATKNKKKIEYYTFINGVFDGCEKYNAKKIGTTFSTRVEFTPNKKYFNTLSFSIDTFKQKLLLVKSLHKDANLYLNDEEIPYVSLHEFAAYAMGLDIELLSDSIVIHLSDKTASFEIDTFIAYDPEGATAVDNQGAVNLHPCSGTYQANINTMYVNVVSELIKEKLTKSEILGRCRFYTNIIMKEPSFGSQNKIEMITNITSKLVNIKEQLTIELSKNKWFQEWFAEVIENKKASVLSKKARKSSKRVGTDNPLKDCKNSPGDILYIVEGTSAEGNLLDFRYINTEAVYPLSGKILNVIKATEEKAIESKKLKYFFEAIGVDFKSNVYRYKHYKILTDADADGMHIAVLVEMVFWKYCSDLIKAGRVSLILPPLFGAMKKKKFIPIYDEKTANKYRTKGYDVQRFKGLGEMNADQLESVIRKPLEYIITPPQSTTEEASILACIDNTQVKHALCDSVDQFNISVVMDACNI